jgi:hypothetical protein
MGSAAVGIKDVGPEPQSVCGGDKTNQWNAGIVLSEAE